MAAIAGLIGAQVIGGIGNNIAEGLKEQRRRSEWESLMNFQKDKFSFEKDFSNRQLEQQGGLTIRGQNFGMVGSAMNVGSSIVGNLLSYKNAQDQLQFQRDLNSERRSDLQREGLPLSYLHLGGGGGFQRSIPNIPMQRTQSFGRSVSNPWGYANSGSNLRETYGSRPQNYGYEFQTSPSGKILIPD